MLREETIEPGTLGPLRMIVKLPQMKQFKLGGGTALSLSYGHRKSVDLDFFSDEPLDKGTLTPALEDKFRNVVPINDRRKNIYQSSINDVKVDFVSVKDPFMQPTEIIDHIPFVGIKDLIALKLNEIKGRGVKKDFGDVARLLQMYSISELFDFYRQRYSYDDSLLWKDPWCILKMQKTLSNQNAWTK